MKLIKLTKTKFYWLTRSVIWALLLASILTIIFSKDNSSDTLSRNIFVILQCVLLTICSFIPTYVEKKWQLEIPNVLEVIYLLFCLAAMLLGEIFQFYATVWWWDKLLHTLSGSIIALVGFSIIKLVNKNEKIDVHLNPFFICMFVVTFSVFIGVIWEIIEFGVDGVFGTNMQRYRNSTTKENFLGHNALFDTMIDLILDTLGSIVVATLGFLDLKKDQNKMEKWLIYRVKEKVNLLDNEEEFVKE